MLIPKWSNFLKSLTNLHSIFTDGQLQAEKSAENKQCRRWVDIENIRVSHSARFVNFHVYWSELPILNAQIPCPEIT